MDKQYIIAYADKTILKISGILVKGLNTRALEEMLMKRMNTLVRVIGVTGDDIEMDVYNIQPEQIRKNQQKLIEAVALIEGIKATELIEISCSNKIVEVDAKIFPVKNYHGCARERWMNISE